MRCTCFVDCFGYVPYGAPRNDEREEGLLHACVADAMVLAMTREWRGLLQCAMTRRERGWKASRFGGALKKIAQCEKNA